MLRTVKVLIRGQVTGVGFRYFLESKARPLGIKGYVKNLAGDIEAVFQSEDEQKLEKMLGFAKTGPLLAKIDEVRIEKLNNQKHFEEFTIQRDLDG